MLSRRHFFFGSLALPAFAAKTPPPRPNVVVIAVDHLPAWVLGCYGNQEIQTPNIDRLAQTGTRFLRNFTCAPEAGLGRAVLLTGRTPMQLHDSAELSSGSASLDKALSGAGYVVGNINGSSGSAAAVQFVNSQSAGKPFSLMVAGAHLNPPYEGVPQKFRDVYANTKFDTFSPETAASHTRTGKEMFADVRASLRKYAAAVSAMDTDVGAIVSQLSSKRLLDNTLIVFTATSGSLLSHHGGWGAGESTDPPNMYEESIATPLIWSWLGRVPAQLTRPEVVSSYDLVPTMCEALGLAPPSGNLCGRSYLLPATGKPLPKKQPWRNTVFGHLGNTDLAREDRYKLVMRGQGPGELYDIIADPTERQNQFDNPQFGTVRSEFAGQITAWKQHYSA